MQRLVEHAQREFLVAAMRAHFGHQENTIADAFQSLAHPIFGFSAMIFPAVIEECDSSFDGIVHQADSRIFVFGIPQVMAAEPECRDLNVMPAEAADRNSCALSHGSVLAYREIPETSVRTRTTPNARGGYRTSHEASG